MKKIVLKSIVTILVLCNLLTLNVYATEADNIVTTEQLENMNEPTKGDAEKISYLTMDSDELISRFKEATKGIVEDTDVYKMNTFTISTNTEVFKEYFPNWTPEQYESLDKYDKFCIFYLFDCPYFHMNSEWKHYEFMKAWDTKMGDAVNAAYAEVNEWHRNNYEMYGVFINPFDNGVVNEANQEEEKSDEEEMREIQDEIAKELGVETTEGKYEKAWKDLLITNIVTIGLIIIAIVVFIIFKRKHKQISND